MIINLIKSKKKIIRMKKMKLGLKINFKIINMHNLNIKIPT